MVHMFSAGEEPCCRGEMGVDVDVDVDRVEAALLLLLPLRNDPRLGEIRAGKWKEGPAVNVVADRIAGMDVPDIGIGADRRSTGVDGGLYTFVLEGVIFQRSCDGVGVAEAVWGCVGVCVDGLGRMAAASLPGEHARLADRP